VTLQARLHQRRRRARSGNARHGIPKDVALSERVTGAILLGAS
jgi:hypothetical protein